MRTPAVGTRYNGERLDPDNLERTGDSITSVAPDASVEKAVAAASATSR